MDTIEIHNLKKEVERRISGLVTDFERKTGLEVTRRRF